MKMKNVENAFGIKFVLLKVKNAIKIVSEKNKPIFPEKSGFHKAQTTAVLLLLVIIIFAGLGVFLLSMAKEVSQTEYMQLYTNQLLLSMLRTDTGYTENDCRLLADAVSCVYFVHPNYRCGGSGPTCFDLASSEIEGLLQKFEMIKGYKYLLTVKPIGFVPHSETGEITEFSVGNSSLEDLKGFKIAATQKLERTTSTGQFILDVRLVLAK
jgi:hypothetical protein